MNLIIAKRMLPDIYFLLEGWERPSIGETRVDA